MLNSIILMGRLTADPEQKTTTSGLSVARFTLAVERNFADKQSGVRATDFIEIVAWRGTADFVSRYFRKGQLMAVQGSLQSHSYEDRDGNKRKAFEVVADNVYFAGSKGDNQTSKPDISTPPREVMSREAAVGVPMNDHSGPDDFVPVPDDDLPF